jgi:itaconyl-CoA hydratase
VATKDLDVSDLPLGASDRTSGRTVSEGEMMVLHHLVGAVSPMHINADYAAKNSPFGVPIMGGGVVAAIIAADWSNTKLYKRLINELGVRATAALGMTVRYRTPLKGGDTIYGVYTIKSVRSSRSRPGYGVLGIDMRGENQTGEALLEGELAMLFDRPKR